MRRAAAARRAVRAARLRSRRGGAAVGAVADSGGTADRPAGAPLGRVSGGPRFLLLALLGAASAARCRPAPLRDRNRPVRTGARQDQAGELDVPGAAGGTRTAGIAARAVSADGVARLPGRGGQPGRQSRSGHRRLPRARPRPGTVCRRYRAAAGTAGALRRSRDDLRTTAGGGASQQAGPRRAHRGARSGGDAARRRRGRVTGDRGSDRHRKGGHQEASRVSGVGAVRAVAAVPGAGRHCVGAQPARGVDHYRPAAAGRRADCLSGSVRCGTACRARRRARNRGGRAGIVPERAAGRLGLLLDQAWPGT